MWDLSSLGRRQTHNPLQWSLNHWTAREIPRWTPLCLKFYTFENCMSPLLTLLSWADSGFLSSLKCFCLLELLPQGTAQLCVLIPSMNQQPRSNFLETLWPQRFIFSDTGIGSEGSSYKLLKMLSRPAGLKKKKRKENVLPYQHIFSFNIVFL